MEQGMAVAEMGWKWINGSYTCGSRREYREQDRSVTVKAVPCKTLSDFGSTKQLNLIL